MFLVSFQRFLLQERGAVAIEYVLLASFIALILVAVLGAMGLELSGLFEQLKNAF